MNRISYLVSRWLRLLRFARNDRAYLLMNWPYLKLTENKYAGPKYRLNQGLGDSLGDKFI